MAEYVVRHYVKVNSQLQARFWVRNEDQPNEVDGATRFTDKDAAEKEGVRVAVNYVKGGHEVIRWEIIDVDRWRVVARWTPQTPLKLRGSFRGADWFHHDPANWAPSRES